MALAERSSDREGFEPRIGRSVSLDNAAELLGVSRRTIYNRIREGRLQTVRTLGGSQRITLESVEEMRALMELPRDERRRASVAVVALAFLALCVARPVAAEHHARLSADLSDHIAHGSQTINVIVDGT